MWVSDKWRDYELIDCSQGEKLERWGDYTLVRPDPQAIWKTPRRDRRWNSSATGATSAAARAAAAWDKRALPASWQIGYGELRFNVKPMNFKHTGIFPEQASRTGTSSCARYAAAGQGRERSEPLRLHGRGHGQRRSRRGRERLPRGRGQGHGGLGEGERRGAQAWRTGPCAG